MNCAPFSGSSGPVTTVVTNPELGCPTALTGRIIAEEPLPEGAGIVAPETEAEIAATEKYLSWSQRNQVWAREGWARAGAGKEYCDSLDDSRSETGDDDGT